MSFDISGPGPIKKPMIQESQNMQNNGGGGNLGYFQRKKKKKEKDENPADVFEITTKKNDDDTIKIEVKDKKSTDTIGQRIRKFWEDLNPVFPEIEDKDFDDKKTE